MGVEDWQGMSQMFSAAFADAAHTIAEIFESGDRVFSGGTFSGAHTGEFMGIAATGKEITTTEMTFDRFDDEGKLVEPRAEADSSGSCSSSARSPLRSRLDTRREREAQRSLMSFLAARTSASGGRRGRRG